MVATDFVEVGRAVSAVLMVAPHCRCCHGGSQVTAASILHQCIKGNNTECLHGRCDSLPCKDTAGRAKHLKQS